MNKINKHEYTKKTLKNMELNSVILIVLYLFAKWIGAFNKKKNKGKNSTNPHSTFPYYYTSLCPSHTLFIVAHLSSLFHNITNTTNVCMRNQKIDSVSEGERETFNDFINTFFICDSHIY